MTKCKINKGLYQSDYEHDACGVGMVVISTAVKVMNWLTMH